MGVRKHSATGVLLHLSRDRGVVSVGSLSSGARAALGTKSLEAESMERLRSEPGQLAVLHRKPALNQYAPIKKHDLYRKNMNGSFLKKRV